MPELQSLLLGDMQAFLACGVKPRPCKMGQAEHASRCGDCRCNMSGPGYHKGCLGCHSIFVDTSLVSPAMLPMPCEPVA